MFFSEKNINRTTLVIVLIIFLTISVGYALFSDTIIIEGTATAQGNFGIEATCITNITPDMLYEFGYKDESCTVNGDRVTYSVGLEYPTTSKFSFVKMKNTGNVSAYFDYIKLVSQYAHNIIKKYNNPNNLLETINTTEDGTMPFLHISINNAVAQNVQRTYYNFMIIQLNL